jgi:hypothetical protein
MLLGSLAMLMGLGLTGEPACATLPRIAPANINAGHGMATLRR